MCQNNGDVLLNGFLFYVDITVYLDGCMLLLGETFVFIRDVSISKVA